MQDKPLFSCENNRKQRRQQVTTIGVVSGASATEEKDSFRPSVLRNISLARRINCLNERSHLDWHPPRLVALELIRFGRA